MVKKTSIEELYTIYVKSGQKICTDTRKIEETSIFFALNGVNFNANEFAQQALNGGCSFAVIDDEKFHINSQTILVNDSLKTLQDLANYHRKQLKIPFLAITGSNGKTTTKELIALILSKKYQTLATFGNLNNHIGVPLTILSIKPEHEIAIIEMGANHQGEIDFMCKIAEPDFGLITNIGKAHLEGFGGIEGVKLGKSELYKFIDTKKGKLFVNTDDEVLNVLSEGMQKYSYGENLSADYVGLNCTVNNMVNLKFKKNSDRRDWNQISIIKTNIIGEYNFINCLAACSIASYFNVDENQIREALQNYYPNMNRSQLIKTSKNNIILDAYNANPNSMRVAIDNFVKVEADKKFVLLGDMFELGDFSQNEHQAIVDLLKFYRFENVILVGPAFQNCTNHSFITLKTTKECSEYLNSHQVSQHYVLIKGSRGMKMETLLEKL